jgi:phosphate transport system substrate-binding protein
MRIVKALSVLAVLLAIATGATLATAAGQVLLNAAGATFPYPMYSKWFDVYHQAHPDVQINYQSIGSGGGIRQLIDKTVDFGASDGPMNDDQLKQASVPILHFPTVLGADVPSYNLPGVSAELNFTPEALGGIFLGKVAKWNDPAIASANPGVKLPSDDIVVVHRSDGSGTTYIWTDYLSKVSPEWQQKVGKATSVNWPVGLGGKGNEGVAGLVQQTPDSIGYIELIYAVQNKIAYGRVKNAAGAFVKADLASVSAAAAASSKAMPDDFRVSITNPEGNKAAYPIASFTWLLIPSKFTDTAKRDAVKDFLKWMMTDGQQYCEGLAYAKLPKEVVAKEMKAIAQIQ